MKTRIVLAIVMLAAVLISGCVRFEFEIELDGQGNELKRTVRFLTQEQQVAAMYLQGIRQDVLESYGEEEMQFVEFTEFDGPEWYGAELVFLVAEAKDSGIDLSEESLVVTDKDDRFTVAFNFDASPGYSDIAQKEWYDDSEFVVRVTVEEFTREYRLNVYDAILNGVYLTDTFPKR
ncbi:MAG: hypothetical protein GX195_01890 [Firmicutes bacterium]|jgi:hypothetical protein|nr:hypothetical protein [Bacillota bacterium]